MHAFGIVAGEGVAEAFLEFQQGARGEVGIERALSDLGRQRALDDGAGLIAFLFLGIATVGKIETPDTVATPAVAATRRFALDRVQMSVGGIA